MENTIRDTFVDLKVEVITATITSLENKMASRFTAVDVALVQLASPPLPATATSPTSQRCRLIYPHDQNGQVRPHRRTMLMRTRRPPLQLNFKQILHSMLGLRSLLAIGYRI